MTLIYNHKVAHSYSEYATYSRVPNKRIDTLIFSKQIHLFWQVLTPSRAVLTSIYLLEKSAKNKRIDTFIRDPRVGRRYK